MPIVAAFAIVVAAGVMASWQPRVEEVEAASVERMAHPLPTKPSIAVMPFDNLSGDPGQDYLSDGVTEAIITTLSKIPKLFVIDGDSTSAYRGKPATAKQVAEEMGVRYVLKGSVQRSGGNMRINAQLIDALKGRYLWAEL